MPTTPGARSIPRARLFNPFTAEFRADPYPAYARVQRLEPVHWSILDSWLVTRYEDVVRVLDDPRFANDRRHWSDFPRYSARVAELPCANAMRRDASLFLDPPEHTTVRHAIAAAFAPAVLPRAAAVVRFHVDALLRRVVVVGQMDVMADIAEQLPSRVLVDLLGLPVEEEPTFREWARSAQALNLGLEHLLSKPALQRAEQAVRSSTQRMLAVIRAQRGSDASEDMLGLLRRYESPRGPLSDNQILNIIAHVWLAGHDTVSGLLGLGTLALLGHPDQFRWLQRQPERIPHAVEEMLRFDAPLQLTHRFATQRLDLGGVSIEPGAMVTACLGAANRDPARFGSPGVFDVGRRDVRHVSFGSGPHTCVGAWLARLQARTFFDALVRRCVDVRLAAEPVDWASNVSVRRPRSVRLEFRPTHAMA